MTAPAWMSTQTRLSLVVDAGTTIPVDVVLRYDSADPYAVTVAFRTGDAGVEWVFARDLLAAGLQAPSGQGDVMIWPTIGAEDETISISLSTPEGHALFEAPRWILQDFVAQSLEAVPSGAEADHLDIDELLAALLAG